MSKGSQRRPRSIMEDEEDLRWRLSRGEITSTEFDREYQELRKRGLIRRNGKKI